jgi:hypothetical protein
MRTALALFVCLSLGFVAACGTTAELSTVETFPPATTTTAAPTTTTTVAPTTTTTVAPTTTTTVALPPPATVAAPEPVYEQPAAAPVQTAPSSDIETLICQTFVNDCGKAIAVAWCESNHNPGVVGGAGERGLFQIHPVHIPNLGPYGGWDAMFDPAANIAYAYALYSGSGWGPWTCA